MLPSLLLRRCCHSVGCRGCTAYSLFTEEGSPFRIVGKVLLCGSQVICIDLKVSNNGINILSKKTKRYHAPCIERCVGILKSIARGGILVGFLVGKPARPALQLLETCPSEVLVIEKRLCKANRWGANHGAMALRSKVFLEQCHAVVV